MIDAISPENLVSWSVQVFVIATLGAVLPVLFRLRHPRSHLIYCHLVLLACLILPFAQPWQSPIVVIGGAMQSATLQTSAAPSASNPALAVWTLPWRSAMVWIFLAGMAARLCWLSAGLWALKRYRDRTVSLYPVPQSIADAAAAVKARARFCISTSVQGPVTFGFLAPVVLLPESFLRLGEAEQHAIACHELLHVRRRDWLVTLAEELASALFWFQPAVWWLLAQARLAREQWVDAQVVRLTEARESYIGALLSMAGVKPQLDLAPAPLFLRRRHLSQRMYSLLSEASMSKLRLWSSYVSMALILAAAGWLALVSFPLAGEAQVQVAAAGLPPAQDPPGVTVNAGGNALRRTAVVYPYEAQQQRIEGAVFVELSVNPNGNVTDARVLSGPEELRRTVLQSVLQWRYAPNSAPTGTVVASVDFRVQPPANPAGPAAAPAPRAGFGYTVPSVSGMPPIRGVQELQGVLTSIDVGEVPEPVRSQLSQRLDQEIGQSSSPALLEQLDRIVRAAIPEGTQRSMRYSVTADGNITLKVTTQVNEAVAGAGPRGRGGSTIHTPFGTRQPEAREAVPGRVRVGAAVMAANLVQQVQPEYPPAAREARISGVVLLEAVIGTNGTVTSLQVMTGHPLFVQPAIDAVSQWIYRPLLLNGVPVETVTTVSVNFVYRPE